jgi:hypothetical protein
LPTAPARERRFDVTWQEELELGEVCVELDTFRDVLVAYAEQEVVP